MNVPALQKLVSDAYAITDSDTSIPKFSTQFTFAEHELLIRIPIYDCQHSMPHLPLILRVINMALPHLKKEESELRQDLFAAMAGKEMTDGGFHIIGVVESSTTNGGPPASAVTEVQIRLREA